MMTALPAQAHTTGPQFVSIYERTEPPAPGMEVTIASTGAAPWVSIRVRAAHVVEIPGLAGEPFGKVSAGGGLANRSSPSYHLTKDPGKVQGGTLAAAAPAPARWVPTGTEPVFSWYEPRAEWPFKAAPAGVKRAGHRATIYHWEIPAAYDGAPVGITGRVDWLPGPFNFEPVLFGLAVVVLLFYMVEERARRRISQIAWASAALVVAGASVDAARSLGEAAGRRWGTPGLIVLALAAASFVPVGMMVRQGRRPAYRAAACFGAYLVVFALIRRSPSALAGGLVSWLNASELALGLALALIAGFLVFLSRGSRSAS